MPKKRTTYGTYSKESRRSSPRSPLPKDIDVFTPLSDLVSDHEKLTSTAVAFVGWRDVTTMLPPCLQGRSRDDVTLLVSDELDGMSRKHILRILQGEDGVTSSSSSSDLSEDEEKVRSSRSSMHSEEEPAMRSYGSSPSKVNGSGTEGESFSDIELIEGLDADSSNLPDVSCT